MKPVELAFAIQKAKQAAEKKVAEGKNVDEFLEMAQADGFKA